MMPHPTTMKFAWDEEVLRCSRVLVVLLVLAVAALIGGSVLIAGVQDPSPIVAEEHSVSTAAYGESWVSDVPK